MTRKNKGEESYTVYCSDPGHYAYDPVRDDRMDFGKLIPKPKSPRKDPTEAVDAVGAFEAWMAVLSHYRYWKVSRDAKRLLRLKAEGVPIDEGALEWARVDARSLGQRARALNKALKFAAEEYGELGVGQEVEVMAERLADLQNYITFDEELRDLMARGKPEDALPDYIARALTMDGRSVQEAIRGVRRVHDTVERTANTICRGRLTVKATTMYEVICVGWAMALASGCYINACSECATLFVSSRSDKETCSDRCRTRRSAHQ